MKGAAHGCEMVPAMVNLAVSGAWQTPKLIMCWLLQNMSTDLLTQKAKVKQAEEAAQACGVAHDQKLAEWRGTSSALSCTRCCKW